MTNRTFKTYQILLNALKRAGVQNPGITSTTLLECFVYNQGQLRAAMVESRGLCAIGGFSAWRDDLIQKGWLNYTLGQYSRHTPGAKLLNYINKEKMVSTQIATEESVFNVDCRVENLEHRVSLLEESIKKMIEEYDPPVTPAKVARHMPNDHLKIVKKGELNECSV
jgi:hypothetical protein